MIQQSKRQFKCPCGKTYKSYPALHTHIKRKHQGEAPGQIALPHNNLATRRGRPAVQMQKNNNNQEKLEQLEALTLIQLGLLKIVELAKDHKIMLSSNQIHTLQFTSSHKIFSQCSSVNNIFQNIFQFLEQFCQHFNSQLNQIIVRTMSLFFWYIQRTNNCQYQVSIINQFLSSGWKQEANLRKLSYDSPNYSTIIKQIFVVMSKWLCLKGLSNKVLIITK